MNRAHLLLLAALLLFTATCLAEDLTTTGTARDLFWFRGMRNRKNAKRAAKRARKQARRKRKRQELRQANQNQNSTSNCHEGTCQGDWNNLDTCDVTCATDNSQVKLYKKIGNFECVQCAECPYHDDTCPLSPPIANSPCDEIGKSCKYCGDCCGEATAIHGCECTDVGGTPQWMCFEAICIEC